MHFRPAFCSCPALAGPPDVSEAAAADVPVGSRCVAVAMQTEAVASVLGVAEVGDV